MKIISAVLNYSGCYPAGSMTQGKIQPNCVLPVLHLWLIVFHVHPSACSDHFSHLTSSSLNFWLFFFCSISFLLYRQSSERREGKNWVNSPELVTDSLLLSDSAHSPMFVLFSHYQSLLLRCASPSLSPSVLITHHLFIHTISFALQICAVSYFAVLCIFSCFHIFTPVNVAWYLLCALVQDTFFSGYISGFFFFYCYLCLKKSWSKPFISTNRWVNSEGGT